MAVWRMSLRVGPGGYEMWSRCRAAGIAAITYHPLETTDLRKYPKGEPRKLWARLEPSQKGSLSRVAYEMKKGDTIYVKQGPHIVGRGRVGGPYKFDTSLVFKEPTKHTPWAHQVPVAWEKGFVPVRVLLGAERTTVLRLNRDRLRVLERSVPMVGTQFDKQSAEEGQAYQSERLFRKRNAALIAARKANSDYSCEICGFDFLARYGDIGKEFIIAHHKNIVSSGPRKTRPSDIALVCGNCHAMLHTKNPPISVEKLRKSLIPRSGSVTPQP